MKRFTDSTRLSAIVSTGCLFLIILACHDHVTSAFSSNAPSSGIRSIIVMPKSNTRLAMAEVSYPFSGSKRENWDRQTSFLAPLFQEYDWSRTRRRGMLSSSLIFGSSFSFLEDDDDDNEDNSILSYLPSEGTGLAPKTKELLQRVTSQYVSGESHPINADEVLAVIHEEYRSYDVPVSVGDATFDVSLTGEENDGDAAKILSFAALHRLPRDVALLLFGPSLDQAAVIDSDIDDDGHAEQKGEENSLVKCRSAFAKIGWKGVRFEKGLALRLKRKFEPRSITGRYTPVPRAWLRSRQRGARLAEMAVKEAANTSAPPRRLLTREQFLATMDEELSSTKEPRGINELRDALFFFPRQKNQMWKRLRRTMARQSSLLKQAGFSGLLSYVALNLAWYTFAIAWQWHRTAATVLIHSGALGSALRRFGRVLVSAYIGSQLTRLLRLKLALALAPLGNKVLQATQRKLRVSENRAFAILTGLLLASCLGIWSIIILGDAAILRAWVIS